MRTVYGFGMLEVSEHLAGEVVIPDTPALA